MAQEKWLVDGPKTIDIESARTLKVGLIGGQIDVIAHDEPGARVEVHSVTARRSRSASTATVEIDHPQLGWDNWLDVFTQLDRARQGRRQRHGAPRHRLNLGVVSAERARSAASPRTPALSTVSGDIVVDSVIGDLSSTRSAARSPCATTTARSARTASAATSPPPAPLHRFASDSVSGSVMLDTADIPDEIKVNTVSGAVTVRLEADVPASYALNTVGGKLQVGDDRDHRRQGPLSPASGASSTSAGPTCASTRSAATSTVLRAVRA